MSSCIRVDCVDKLFEWDSALFKGSGGFADVYATRCRKDYDGSNPNYVLDNGDTYAIKVISKARIKTQQDFWKRLMHETGILERLDHPNCIAMYDAFQDDTNVYIVLELVDGGELFDVCADNSLTESDSAHIIKQLLMACRYLHSQQIVHRDIKLENVLVSKDLHNVKLIDFGLAKFFGAGLPQQVAFQQQHGFPAPLPESPGSCNPKLGTLPQPLPDSPSPEAVPSGITPGDCPSYGLGVVPKPLPPPTPEPSDPEASFKTVTTDTTSSGDLGIGVLPQPLPPSPDRANNESATTFSVQREVSFQTGPPRVETFEKEDSQDQFDSAAFGSDSLSPQSQFISTPCGTVDYLAPEVLSHLITERVKPRYTTRHDIPKLDVFAVGMVAYLMLGGSLFPESDEMNAQTTYSKLKKMKEGTFFSQEFFGEVSPDAKDFCGKLLSVDVTQRPSAEEALLHPWVCGQAPKTPICSVPSGYLDKSFNSVFIDTMRQDDDKHTQDVTHPQPLVTKRDEQNFGWEVLQSVDNE